LLRFIGRKEEKPAKSVKKKRGEKVMQSNEEE